MDPQNLNQIAPNKCLNRILVALQRRALKPPLIHLSHNLATRCILFSSLRSCHVLRTTYGPVLSYLIEKLELIINEQAKILQGITGSAPTDHTGAQISSNLEDRNLLRLRSLNSSCPFFLSDTGILKVSGSTPIPWSGPFQDHGLRPWSPSPSEHRKP